MDLNLDEAATLLGLSVRQVRYRVQAGELPARKEGGRWRIRREDLAEGPGRSAAQERRSQALRETVERVLEGRAPRFGVEGLRAMQVLLRVAREVQAGPGREHPAFGPLREAMVGLAQGVHRYHREEKAEAFRRARDAASRAVVELLLWEEGAARARELEAEVLPGVGGLIRRAEGGERGGEGR